MKLKTEVIAPEFSPVKVEIIIESVKELQHLWHTLNVSEHVVRERADSSMPMPYFYDDDHSPGYKLWKAIDDICTDRHLKEDHEDEDEKS